MGAAWASTGVIWATKFCRNFFTVLLPVKTFLLDPMEAVGVERERLQFDFSEPGLDLLTIHLAAQRQQAGRRLVKMEAGHPVSGNNRVKLQVMPG